MAHPGDKRQLAVALYESGQSIYDIAPQVGVAPQTVHKWLVATGVKCRSKSEAGSLAVQSKGKWQQRYVYNHSAFQEIVAPEQAYWLGFLAADGTINKNGVVQVSLGIKDITQLMKFKQFLETDAEISEFEIDDELGKRRACRLNVCPRQIWDDLNRHGLKPCKTETVQWPHWLPLDLKWAYLLGYFDGDGGYCFDKNRNSSVQWSIAGHPSFLLDAQQFLMDELGLNRVKLITRRNTKAIKSLNYGGTVQVASISLQMYRSCPVRMERKLERFVGYLKANPNLIRLHFKVLEELGELLQR